MADKHWSIETALEQLRKCDYECEGGPLANNVAWQWLEAAATVGPEYWPGQGVWFKATATSATGKVLSEWEHFYIVGCQMSSDNERRFWLYDLSQDPPGPWNYGTVQIKGAKGRDLSLVNPEQGEAA